MLKKLLIYTLAVTTICWSVGLVMLVPAAHAALATGSLVKLTGSATVYYIGADGKRYTFTDELSYKTWYSDFSSVQEVASLADYDPGGNVTARPGAKLLQEVTDDSPWQIVSDKVYAVDKDGLLHWVSTAEVAVEVFGADWATMIVPVSYAIGSYTVGSELTAAADYDKDEIYAASPTISVDKGLSDTAETDPVVDVGTFTVSVSTDSPVANSIPQEAQGVQYLKFDVAATDGDVVVEEVVLRRTGAGAASDFDNVYLYDGVVRLTSGRSLATDTHTVTVPNLNVSVPNGTSKSFTVKVDMNSGASAGSVSRFEVYSINDLAIAGVYGSYMTVATVTATTTTIDRTSSSWQVVLGSSEAEVAKFQLAGGTQNAYLTGLTLTNTGTLSSGYLDNFKLMLGTTEIASAAAMTGDKVIFNFPSAYVLEDSTTKNFIVKADNTGGRTDRTTIFYIEEASDIALEDAVYGGGSKLTFDGFNASTDACTVTYKGGDVTIGHDGPIASSYATNSRNNQILNFRLTASQNITVKRTTIYIASLLSGTQEASDSANYPYIKNVKLYDLDNERTLVGPQSTATALGTHTTSATAPQGWNREFSNAFNVAAGETLHLSVQVDIDSSYSTALGNQITAYVDLSGSTYVYDNDAGEYVSSTYVVPNAFVSNTHTVTSSSLTIANASVTNYEVVKGAQEVLLLAPLATSGSADDVQMNRMYVRIYADDDAPAAASWDSGTGDVAANTIVQTVSLYEHTSSGDTLISGPVNLALDTGSTYAAGTNYFRADFSSLAYPIPQGAQKTLYVKANLTNTFTDTTYLTAGLVPASDVEAENSMGTVLSTIGGSTLNGTTTKAAYATAYQAGSLAVAVHGDTPVADVVVSGTSDVEFTKYKFTASYEPMLIKGLEIYNANSGTAGDYDDNIEPGMVTLSYSTIDDAGVVSDVTKTVSLSAGARILTQGQVNIYCPKDQDAVLTIKAKLRKVVDGADSGDLPRIGLTKASAQFSTVANLADTFIVVGAHSGTTLTGDANDITLVDEDVNAMTVAKTKVTVVKDSTSPSGSGTAGPADTIAHFKFTSTAEPGSNESSVLSTVNVLITGQMIDGSVASDAVTVTLYREEVSTDAILESKTCDIIAGPKIDCAFSSIGDDLVLGVADTEATETSAEFSGDMVVLVTVTDTDSDADFAASMSTKTISAQLDAAWIWQDGTSDSEGTANTVTAGRGFPVLGNTLIY